MKALLIFVVMVIFVKDATCIPIVAIDVLEWNGSG